MYNLVVKDKILRHFRKNDPVMYEAMKKVIKNFPDADIFLLKRDSEDLFLTLCRSIINQQLSNKAAATIFKRFKRLFRGKITPGKLLKINDRELRGAGISFPKIGYLKDLAAKVKSGEVELEKFVLMSDEKIIEELVNIKGIGRWTAEMFLMFALGREDVYSHGDLILRKSLQKLYKLKNEPTLLEAQELTKVWSPYKSFASRVLWRVYRLEI